MVRADKFVTNKKEFMFIALAPFVIINAILLILLIFVSQPWALTILEVLFTHTAFASDDFGLLSCFDLHKSLDGVTIDNKAHRAHAGIPRLRPDAPGRRAPRARRP